MKECISLSIEQKIATLTLKRPNVMNAINEQMVSELNKALDEVEQDDQIHVLIIQGEGKAFCAGADTNVVIEKNPEESQKFIDSILHIFTRIQNLQIPVIGVVSGYAFGGGAQLAIACDIRIGSEASSFRFPGASYGLVVSGYLLPTIVGMAKAKELLYSSKIVLAKEALGIGLLNEMTQEGTEYEVAMDLARMICKNQKKVLCKIKQVVNKGVGRTIEERLELEDSFNRELLGTTSQRETFVTFTSRRKNKHIN